MLPAYAGMIRHDPKGDFTFKGAPRVCGDDPTSLTPSQAHPTVLPAYAGMIPAAGALQIAWEGAPRVCGDDPGSVPSFPRIVMCSPRMRG